MTTEMTTILKIMQAKGDSAKFLDHTTTIWFASDYSKPKDNST